MKYIFSEFIKLNDTDNIILQIFAIFGQRIIFGIQIISVINVDTFGYCSRSSRHFAKHVIEVSDDHLFIIGDEMELNNKLDSIKQTYLQFIYSSKTSAIILSVALNFEKQNLSE